MLNFDFCAGGHLKSAFSEGLEARSMLGRLYGVFRICMVDALMKNAEARSTLSTSHGALEITNFPVFP